MKSFVVILTITATPMIAPAFADEKMSLVSIQSPYSCEEARKLKFDEINYTALNPDSQMSVDSKYHQCKLDDEARAQGTTPRTVVIVRDPDGKIFYGTIKREDLENAQKNCTGAGQLGGAAIAIYGKATGAPGAEITGAVIQRYTNVSCASIAGALEDDNLFAVLAPLTLIGNAVGAEALTNIIPMSDADKEAIIKGATPSITEKDGKVHIDIGPGGGIGFKLP